MNDIATPEPNSYLALQAYVRRIRLVLQVIPALIMAPVLWYTYTEMLRTAAKIQFVSEAAHAGLLNMPGIKLLAEKMLEGNSSYTVLLFAATVVMVLCIGFASRAKLVSSAAASQLEQEQFFGNLHGPNDRQATKRTQTFDDTLSDGVTPYYPATNDDWKATAYPLNLLSIQAQGTQHASRPSIIKQLEIALERLKAGDVQGEDHDDDFGYRFIEHNAMEYSIFKDGASYR